MMSQSNKPMTKIARKNGITEQTFYAWCGELKVSECQCQSIHAKDAEDSTSEDKFAVMRETAIVNVAKISRVLSAQKAVCQTVLRLAEKLSYGQCGRDLACTFGNASARRVKEAI